MDVFAILDLALPYCSTLLSTRDRNLRLPGAFLGRLPLPITMVLEEGWIENMFIECGDDDAEEEEDIRQFMTNDLL